MERPCVTNFADWGMRLESNERELEADWVHFKGQSSLFVRIKIALKPSQEVCAVLAFT